MPLFSLCRHYAAAMLPHYAVYGASVSICFRALQQRMAFYVTIQRVAAMLVAMIRTIIAAAAAAADEFR